MKNFTHLFLYVLWLPLLIILMVLNMCIMVVGLIADLSDGIPHLLGLRKG